MKNMDADRHRWSLFFTSFLIWKYWSHFAQILAEMVIGEPVRIHI